ncbi:hypothetical protein GCM10027408_08320 [Microbacterium tumbae]
MPSNDSGSAGHRRLIRYELYAQWAVGPFWLHRLDWYVLEPAQVLRSGHIYAFSLRRARARAARRIARLTFDSGNDPPELPTIYDRDHPLAVGSSTDYGCQAASARQDPSSDLSRLDLLDGLGHRLPVWPATPPPKSRQPTCLEP